MTYEAGLRRAATDLKISVLFSTRLPFARSFAVTGADIARASWALPLAGALIGLLGAIAYWLAHAVGLPPLPAGALALATTLVATGCLHEDGLADTADGFGGGTTRERKLEIMRDSRIGSYGACALMLLRGSALASLAEAALVAGALVAAHASARATMPVLMWLVPRARPDGLSADAGPPPGASVAAAVVLGVIALALGLDRGAAIAAVLLLVAVVACVAWLSREQVGGQTGDVLGALEQVSEITVLLAAAAA
jgi:adenosylcobinamide-GDP ribazoletransferase